MKEKKKTVFFLHERKKKKKKVGTWQCMLSQIIPTQVLQCCLFVYGSARIVLLSRNLIRFCIFMFLAHYRSGKE